MCVLPSTEIHFIIGFVFVIANVGRHCLLGKIPMELLHLSWEKSPNLSLGERAEMLSTVDMRPCFMKVS